MSRIAKKPIPIPAKTEVAVAGSTVTVKGPKGTLVREFAPEVAVAVEGNAVSIELKDDSNTHFPKWGTAVSHLKNMVKGVNESFTKKLVLEGIGYKADVKGTDLVLALGLSHPVKVPIPQTLKVASDKGIVTVSGLDKDEVGQFAANIRALKKPEPYKGKGFRYEDEVIRRKQGKKSV